MLLLNMVPSQRKCLGGHLPCLWRTRLLWFVIDLFISLCVVILAKVQVDKIERVITCSLSSCQVHTSKHECLACLEKLHFCRKTQPRLYAVGACVFFIHVIVCITFVWMHMCVFLCPLHCTGCLCVCLCGGCSQCSTLYKHISWADSAQWEGESA